MNRFNVFKSKTTLVASGVVATASANAKSTKEELFSHTPDIDAGLHHAYMNRNELDWRQRLNLMWRWNETRDPSPEMKTICISTTAAIFYGFGLGAYVKSRETLQQFMEKNKHTMFASPFEAQRCLRDELLLSYAKGGTHYAWRLGVMVFIFTATSGSLTAIRGDVNPGDYAAARGVMGASVRFYKLGLRGATVGAIVGAFLGLVGGVAAWASQRISGETIHERWLREFKADEECRLKRLQEERKRQAESLGRGDLKTRLSNAVDWLFNDKSD